MALKLVMVLALSAFAIGGKLSQELRTGKMPQTPRVREQPPYRFPPTGNGRGNGNGQKLFCGNSPSNRIVGGTEAPQGAWPWQAMILKRFGNSYGQWCGGTLIGPNWVVTAAHCIENIVNNNDRKIRLGAHYFDHELPGEQAFYPAKYIPHPRYNDPNSMSNDIAMLKLPRPATINDQVQLACLPGSFGEVSPGKMCWVTGWGYTSPKSNVLRQVDVPIVSRATCQQAYWYDTIDESMICAGYAQGGKDSCSGDSGGPLVCKYFDWYFLEGVVSWGEGCARPGKYGVYANVRNLFDWIDNVMKTE